MITLTNNSLAFSFPDLDRQLSQEIQAWASRQSGPFTDAFRAKMQNVLSHVGCYHELALKPEAAGHLQTLTDSMIQEAWMNAWDKIITQSMRPGSLTFMRTLRLPDDGAVYPLPAGLGTFPLVPVDHHPSTAPAHWLERGGVMLPMYQSEALWISFDSRLPLAVKLVSGSVNALTGEAECGGLFSDPQNYLTLPEQPWIDGFKVSPHTVRQFVAMPVGSGFTASEQLAPDQNAAGLIVEVIPPKMEFLAQEVIREHEAEVMSLVIHHFFAEYEDHRGRALFSRSRVVNEDVQFCMGEMGLGGGGRIQQEIYSDERGVDAWDLSNSVRVCIHICNSMSWRAVTGGNPPHPPVTAAEYSRHGIPWFDFYRDDLTPVPETAGLASLQSIDEVAKSKGLAPMIDSDLKPGYVVQYGNARRPETIRAWGRSTPGEGVPSKSV